MKEITGDEISHAWGYSVIPGTMVITATRQDLPYLVGVVWYAFGQNNTRLSLLNSFVHEDYRRQGIRTYLHRQLILGYPDVKYIVTCRGTKSGKAWLIAAGFKQHDDGWWKLRICRKSAK